MKPVEQTPEERLASIVSTFSAIDIPLSDVKHPTKPHLQAVESFDILPDEDLWANQYALFKFADNPNDRRVGHAVRLQFSETSCLVYAALVLMPFLVCFRRTSQSLLHQLQT